MLERREEAESKLRDEIDKLKDMLERTQQELSNKNTIIAIRNGEIEDMKRELQESKWVIEQKEREIEDHLRVKNFYENQIDALKKRIPFDKVLNIALDNICNIYNASMDHKIKLPTGSDSGLQAYYERLKNDNDKFRENIKLYFDQFEFDLLTLGIELVSYEPAKLLPKFENKKAYDMVDVIGVVNTLRKELEGRVYKCSSFGYNVSSVPEVQRKCKVVAYLYTPPEEEEVVVKDNTEKLSMETKTAEKEAGGENASASAEENDENKNLNTAAEAQSIYNSPKVGDNGVKADFSVDTEAEAEEENGEGGNADTFRTESDDGSAEPGGANVAPDGEAEIEADEAMGENADWKNIPSVEVEDTEEVEVSPVYDVIEIGDSADDIEYAELTADDPGDHPFEGKEVPEDGKNAVSYGSAES